MVGDEQSVLTKLLVRLGLLQPEAKGGGKSPQLVRGNPQSFAAERRLDSILSRHHTDVGDRVYLIGLGKVREMMGSKWEQSQDKIHLKVQEIIERRVSAEDLVVCYDDTSYLIVFSGVGAKEAQLRCTIISEEILTRLAGRESASKLMEVKKVTVDEGGRIEYERLPAVDELLEDVVESLRSQPDRERSRKKEPSTDMAGGGVDDLSDVRFIFRPLLALRTKIISTFMCLPVRQAGGRFASGYDVLRSTDDPADIFELDMLSLRTAAMALQTLRKTRKRSLLALPVHFETLANHRRNRKFTDLCGSSFSGLENRVVFELVGLPDGIPQARLVELVSALRPRSRSVMARFSLEHVSFPAFRTAGLHAVGVDVFGATTGEGAIMKEMDAFVDHAKDNQLKTYALGVRTLSLYTAAVASGFDYLAGYALSPVAAKAGDIYPFHMDMPYLSLLEQESSGT